MSVISVSIEDTWCDVDRDQSFNYTTIYHAITDSNSDNARTVAAHPDVPRIGDSYSVGNDSDPDAFAVAGNLKRTKTEGTYKHWGLTIIHSTKQPSSRDASTAKGNPLSNGGNWKVSGSFQRGSRHAYYDRHGEPLWYSNEERMNIEVPYGHDTLVLVGNTSSLNRIKRAKAIFHTNSHEIWGYPADSLLLTQWTFDSQWAGPTAFISNHLEFDVSYDLDHEGNYIGWKLDIEDWGRRIILDHNENDPAKRYYTPCPGDVSMKDGFPLDGNGDVLPFDSPETSIWLLKEPIPQFDFRTLGLPTTLPGASS
jgi:hypothetical protein